MTTELILLNVPDYLSAPARPLLFLFAKPEETHIVDGQTGQSDLDLWRNHLPPASTDINTLMLALYIIQI